jgi:hypothetical protein
MSAEQTSARQAAVTVETLSRLVRHIGILVIVVGVLLVAASALPALDGDWFYDSNGNKTSLGAPVNHLLRVLGVVTAIGGVGLIFVSGYVEEDAPSAAS